MRRYLDFFLPVSLPIIVNFIAFYLLYLYIQPSNKILLFVSLILNAMISITYFVLLKKGLGDEYLFLIVAMLLSLGIIMIYRLDIELGHKQMVWFAVGIVLFFISYNFYIKIHSWDKYLYIYIGISFALFLLTLAFGKEIKGANNWIVINGHSFQPSELIKILFIFFLASYYKNQEKLDIAINEKFKIPNRLVCSVIVYTFLGFLALQREWGTILIFFILFLMMMYAFDNNIKVIMINSMIVLVGGILASRFEYHIRVRVKTWLNPWEVINGKGYQITQSLFAIGSGDFFGTGLGMGRPDLIPEVYSDFIFSAICEEMGIFGGIAVILLFFILTYRGFKIALSVDEMFDKAAALGITILFGFQTFIIIGGVTKLIPLTGITLPFTSYGGSSLVTSFVALGFLQAISYKNRLTEAKIAYEDK